jgi:hypothetical protein
LRISPTACGLHVSDLGGIENISEAEHAIVRRASVLIVELERMERDFALANGSPDIPTLDAYQRTCNSLRRLLEAVGLQRRAKDVTPTLEAYLAAEEDAVGGAAGEANAQTGTETAESSENRTGEAAA